MEVSFITVARWPGIHPKTMLQSTVKLTSVCLALGGAAEIKEHYELSKETKKINNDSNSVKITAIITMQMHVSNKKVVAKSPSVLLKVLLLLEVVYFYFYFYNNDNYFYNNNYYYYCE